MFLSMLMHAMTLSPFICKLNYIQAKDVGEIHRHQFNSQNVLMQAYTLCFTCMMHSVCSRYKTRTFIVYKIDAIFFSEAHNTFQ